MTAARRARRPLPCQGFTLLETALATIIVGVGTTAAVQLMGKGTVANDGAAEMTTALNLANCVHEMVQGLPSFCDTNNTWGLSGGYTKFNTPYVVGLDGQTFSPPVDARRQAQANFPANWSQTVQVRSVDTNNVKFAEPSNDATAWPVARVTVTVNHNGVAVCSQSWLMVRTK